MLKDNFGPCPLIERSQQNRNYLDTTVVVDIVACKFKMFLDRPKNARPMLPCPPWQSARSMQ